VRGICWTLLGLLQLGAVLAAPGSARSAPSDELRPKHVTPEALRAVNRGLEYLAAQQDPNGSWQTMQDGSVYPVSMTALAGMAFLAHGNTPSRGPYADTVQKTEAFLSDPASQSQLRASPGMIARTNENGRPMYGHGFAMLFLSCVYGMETDARKRARIEEVITEAIKLTAWAQSPAGGWTYSPRGGDEGSVTVTQMQALRAAHNAGFTVPRATVEEAVRYLERCRAPGGGIRYSYMSGGEARLPISAAAIACLYSAGEYDSPLADECLRYVYDQFRAHKDSFGKGSGHDFYLHLYAAQAFYQAGDEYWDAYFPGARDHLLKLQQEDGHWDGDGVGPVYGTSIALVVLQLPYKFLPIYQR
jgi:hypothetical protein